MKDNFPNLDKVFENRVRLGIMSMLMVNDWMDFNTMKEKLGVTDGNLASHLTTLEKNDLIEVRKQFVGRKPNTRYSATFSGRKAFEKHLDQLEKIIRNYRK
jgi:predicted ArsR family transcriptional regulator